MREGNNPCVICGGPSQGRNPLFPFVCKVLALMGKLPRASLSSHPLRTLPPMTSPTDGRKTIEYLISRGSIERIDGSAVSESATAIIERASRRLLTAEGGLNAGDPEGAFAAAYEAYRKAAEALLICQGLRATGAEGSHVTVEDAISAQFTRLIPGFAKPTFERLRRTRHSVQYFDPSNVEISVDDSEWAISTATKVVQTVQQILRDDPPELIR